jgi:hypothetical protein
MTDKDFLDNGFIKFNPGPFDGGVDTCFQRSYKDDVGEKYYITVKKWGTIIHPHTGDTIPLGYEYDVQLYKKEGHDAVDLLFHSSWELKDVEDYLEKLWQTGLFDYCEKFE